jgi:hypothetical protein
MKVLLGLGGFRKSRSKEQLPKLLSPTIWLDSLQYIWRVPFNSPGRRQAMITTTLNVQRQTQHLRSTTLAYDAEELEALIAAPTDQPPRDARSTQVLSPALLAQILAQPEGKHDEQAADFNA